MPGPIRDLHSFEEWENTLASTQTHDDQVILLIAHDGSDTVSLILKPILTASETISCCRFNVDLVSELSRNLEVFAPPACLFYKGGGLKFKLFEVDAREVLQTVQEL